MTGVPNRRNGGRHDHDHDHHHHDDHDHDHDHHHHDDHDHDHDHHHHDDEDVRPPPIAYPDHYLAVALRRGRDAAATEPECWVPTHLVPGNLAEGSLVMVSTIDGRRQPAKLSLGAPGDEVQLSRPLRMSLGVTIRDRVDVTALDAQPANALTVAVVGDLAEALSSGAEISLQKALCLSGTPVAADSNLLVDLGDGRGLRLFVVDEIEGGPGPLAPDAKVRVIHGADAQFTAVSRMARFSDIGGLQRETALLRQLVELPVRFPYLYRGLGVNPIRGVMFHGPPGTGKTHVARAVAGQLSARFFYINAADVAGRMAVEAEDELRRIFHEAAHSAPAIIFVDEIDALAPKRDTSGLHRDTKLVSLLLTLMDGLRHRNGTIVIGTTNRIDSIDPALRRPGRFEREILFRLPDAHDRLEILDVHTREMPLTESAVDYLHEVAAATNGFTGADLMSLVRSAALSALREIESPAEAGLLRVTKHDMQHGLADTSPAALREVGRHARRVRLDQVGGLGALQERLDELIELAHDLDLAHDLGLSTGTGVLLHGPSGTGKSLLVHALAHERGVHLVTVRATELFSKWLGESEGALRYAFAVARQVAPAMLLIEQLDAIAGSRRDAEGGSPDKLLEQLLLELDQLEHDTGLIVIGTTERLENVHPSILRSGRFTHQLHVELPDRSGRADIIAIHLGPVAEHLSEPLDAIAEEVAEATEGWSGADLKALVDEAKRRALRRSRADGAPVTLSANDLLTSGSAMPRMRHETRV